MKKKCLFCGNVIISDHTKEHIIPESLGNNKFIISGVICNTCNNEKLSELDEHFCNNNFFAELKVLKVNKTKKGKYPQQKLEHGKIEKTENKKIKLVQNEISAKDLRIIIDEGGWKFHFTQGKLGTNSHKISRFLTKVGIESLYYFNGDIEYHEMFEEARKYTFENQKHNFIPFSWKQTNSDKMGLFICKVINENLKRFYILKLSIFKCDYYIQLNNPFISEALCALNNEFGLN